MLDGDIKEKKESCSLETNGSCSQIGQRKTHVLHQIWCGSVCTGKIRYAYAGNQFKHSGNWEHCAKRSF